MFEAEFCRGSVICIYSFKFFVVVVVLIIIYMLMKPKVKER